MLQVCPSVHKRWKFKGNKFLANSQLRTNVTVLFLSYLYKKIACEKSFCKIALFFWVLLFIASYMAKSSE